MTRIFQKQQSPLSSPETPMRRFYLFLIAVFYLAPSLSAQDDDAKALYMEAGKLVQHYSKAWNQKDADSMAKLFTPRGNHISSSGVKTSSYKNLAKLYTDTFTTKIADRSTFYGKSTGVQLIKKDVGILDVTGTSAATVEGRLLKRKIRFTIVAQKLEGEWRIAAIRFSTPEFPSIEDK